MKKNKFQGRNHTGTYTTIGNNRLTPEERKNKLKNGLHIANIAVFASVLSVVSMMMLISERPTVSETENRMLASFPEFSLETLKNGEFTNGLSDYFNDTVPLRKDLKDMAASIKSYSGVELGGVKVYSVNNGSQGKNNNKNQSQSPAVTEAVTTPAVTEIPVSDINEPEVTEISVTEAVTEPTVPAIPEDDITDAGEISNDIMIYKNRGIMIFYGDDDCCADYAAAVNEFKARLGENINVYSMVCPTSISFYWPSSSDITHGDESQALDTIKKSLVNVTDINTIPVLTKHRNEAIYSRTDHHWQARGAYYAAQLFAETAGVPYSDLSAYEEVVVPDYVGTLYGYSGAAELNNNPEDFTYYVPQNNYTTRYYTTSFEYNYEGPLLVEAYGVSLYCTYMGGDEQIVHVETDAPNDRTLFIVKDSYGNALVPFLTGSFKNIFVIDMRYFDLDLVTFMNEHNATDVLFAMNTFSAISSNYNLYDLLGH